MHGEIRKWASTRRTNWDGWWRCVYGLHGSMWASSLLVPCRVWRPSKWSPFLNAFVGLWMFCGLRKNMQSHLWSPWIPWLQSQICGTQTKMLINLTLYHPRCQRSVFSHEICLPWFHFSRFIIHMQVSPGSAPGPDTSIQPVAQNIPNQTKFCMRSMSEVQLKPVLRLQHHSWTVECRDSGRCFFFLVPRQSANIQQAVEIGWFNEVHYRVPIWKWMVYDDPQSTSSLLLQFSDMRLPGRSCAWRCKSHLYEKCPRILFLKRQPRVEMGSSQSDSVCLDFIKKWVQNDIWGFWGKGDPRKFICMWKSEVSLMRWVEDYKRKESLTVDLQDPLHDRHPPRSWESVSQKVAGCALHALTEKLWAFECLHEGSAGQHCPVICDGGFVEWGSLDEAHWPMACSRYFSLVNTEDMPAPAPTQKLPEDSCQRRMAVPTFIIFVTPIMKMPDERTSPDQQKWIPWHLGFPSPGFILNLTLDRKCQPLSWLRRVGWILSAGWGCGVEWNKSHMPGQDTLVPTQKLEDPEGQMEAWHLLSAMRKVLVFRGSWISCICTWRLWKIAAHLGSGGTWTRTSQQPERNQGRHSHCCIVWSWNLDMIWFDTSKVKPASRWSTGVFFSVLSGLACWPDVAERVVCADQGDRSASAGNSWNAAVGGCPSD